MIKQTHLWEERLGKNVNQIFEYDVATMTSLPNRWIARATPHFKGINLIRRRLCRIVMESINNGATLIRKDKQRNTSRAYSLTQHYFVGEWIRQVIRNAATGTGLGEGGRWASLLPRSGGADPVEGFGAFQFLLIYFKFHSLPLISQGPRGGGHGALLKIQKSCFAE